MEVAMAEHPNVQRIRDAYAALAEGDLNEALKDIAPTATFHIGGSGPLSGDRPVSRASPARCWACSS
jgi:ketosteroid isomerase-like protein